MSLYLPTGIENDIRVAMGEMLPPPPQQIIFENRMPAPYISEQMGMVVESQQAVTRVQSGELFTTVKGDFVQVEYEAINSQGEVITTEAIQVDTGEGVEQLQTVGPVEQAEEFIPPPEQPFYSESAISTNPYETAVVEYYVHPEIPTETVEFTVGDTAPVYYGPTQEYVYYQLPGSTSSPTQDLIGYGEVDINGNPLPVYQIDYSAYDQI